MEIFIKIVALIAGLEIITIGLLVITCLMLEIAERGKELKNDESGKV